MNCFSISLKGLTASLTDENEIIFYDAETGEQKYYFPAPYMVDADGNISYDVVYRIDSEEEDDTEENDMDSESESEEAESESTETESESTEAESESTEAESESADSESEAIEAESESMEAEGESTEAESAFDEESDAEEEGIEENNSEEGGNPEEAETAEEEEPETKQSMSIRIDADGPTLDGSAGGPVKESEESKEQTPTTEGDREEDPDPDEIGEAEEKDERETEPESEPKVEQKNERETERESEAERESESQDAPDSDTDQTVTISIVPDSAWLETAQYPVTIDPVLKKVSGAKEITKVSINNKNNTRDTTTLRVGKKSGALYRSFIKFDLPALPKNSIITSAELTSETGSGSSSGTLYIEAHMAGKQWQPGSISWSNQPQDPKQNKLLDYAQSNSYFDITKAVREWYAGTSPNYGILFKAHDETQNRSKTLTFKSSKTKPYLKLNYIAAGGTESYWTTHQAAAGTAGAAYINDYLGYLTVVNTDVQTAGIRMPMNIQHVYNSCQTDTDTGAGYGWRLNYQQTLKIPTDTVDVTEYPYVWTDGDGGIRRGACKAERAENGV